VKSTSAALEADLVVVGGGMAGMTAAAYAAKAGARVVVFEKSPELGGSAVMSHGYVWTAPTLDLLLEEDPAINFDLAKVLVEDFPRAVEWIQSTAIANRPVSGMGGFGRGIQIDIAMYMRRCRAIVEATGGWVLTAATVQGLVVQAGEVRGVNADDARIDAPWTLLATGGFLANPELVHRFIDPRAEPLFVRSNRFSTGDGMRLALEAGAAIAGRQGAFYGHLLPSPLNRMLVPSEFIDLAQYHSAHCVMLDWEGRRFTDESRGDHIIVQDVARLEHGLALLVADERIRQKHVLAAFLDGMDAGVDKLQLAAEAGARIVRADRLEELAVLVRAWGVDAGRFLSTLKEYNQLVESRPAALTPPRRHFHEPLLVPPFVVLEVQPAITIPYQGLQTTVDGQVVGASGKPIPGLLVAGVDAGGFYDRGYAGSLGRAAVFAIRAATLAIDTLRSPGAPARTERLGIAGGPAPAQ
jgi:succinate dehydrogenase/fumarate reductase flavoprotein subunit